MADWNKIFQEEYAFSQNGVSGDAAKYEQLLQEELNIDNLLKAYHSSNPSTFAAASKRLKSYLQTGSAVSVANIIMPWKFNAFSSWGA